MCVVTLPPRGQEGKGTCAHTGRGQDQLVHVDALRGPARRGPVKPQAATTLFTSPLPAG